jgi:hypothetical protein
LIGLVRRQQQLGQVLPIAAIAMVAMIGALAMVVDTGMFYVTQRQLQASSDAAALAAAWYPPVCLDASSGCRGGDATTIARQIAAANSDSLRQLCDGPVTVNVTLGTPPLALRRPANVNWIVVESKCSAGYSFGRILGLPNKPISASSAAAIGVRSPSGEMGDYVSLNNPLCATDFNPPCLVARLVE